MFGIKKYIYCTMIEIKNGWISARNLHATLDSKQQFGNWVSKKIEQADLLEGVDYHISKLEMERGRPRTEYSFTLEATKEICLLEQTQKGKELRRYLIKLADKVANFELLTTEQIGYMMKVIKCLQYITNQKEAYDLHQTSFVSQSTAKNPYAEFAMYRSRITGWDKEKVEKAFNEWLLTQGRATSKLKSQVERINAMDASEAIRVAVMDILYANGSEGEMAKKFADAIKRLSNEMEIKASRVNEANLYREKENVMDVNKIRLIG